MNYDVCIIGGGQSGLATLKTFSEKTENVILLEKCNNCVGLFAHIKEDEMFKWSTSRYMSGFSDFPIPKTVPVWFTIKDYVKYLESYKDHFNLDKYIHYNSTVKRCYQDNNENWIVKYNNTRLICKKLIICTGLNQTKKYPDIISNFEGKIIHTDDVYRNMNKNDWNAEFSNKRILLLGGAESAYDIGHVLVQYSKDVYYATKNYTEWFPKGAEEPEIFERVKQINDECLTKVFQKKYGSSLPTPTDTQLHYLEYSLPEPMSHLWHEYGRSLLLKILNYDCAKCTHQHAKLCSLTETPDNLFKKYVVKRTEFMLDIHEKKVELVVYPYKIEGLTVYTKDLTINNVDIIVCASGYKKEFPFLDDDVWKGELIKKMIPVNYNNIAFIGYARPTMGSIASVAEMQGWWIEKYFNDPSFNYRVRTPLFRNIDPLDLSNEHINTVVIGCFYIKDLAKDLHIEPNMFYLLLTDFELFFRIYCGSCHPMMYRIHGYKSYEGGRKVLLDTYVSNEEKKTGEWLYIFLFIVFHSIFIIFLFSIAFALVFLSTYIVKNKPYTIHRYNISIFVGSFLIFFFYKFF
jgi:thioredoxin reductase